MESSLAKHFIACYYNIGGSPELIGYHDIDERDTAFEKYIVTGAIEVWQHYGNTTIKPMLARKMEGGDYAIHKPLH